MNRKHWRWSVPIIIVTAPLAYWGLRARVDLSQVRTAIRESRAIVVSSAIIRHDYPHEGDDTLVLTSPEVLESAQQLSDSSVVVSAESRLFTGDVQLAVETNKEIYRESGDLYAIEPTAVSVLKVWKNGTVVMLDRASVDYLSIARGISSMEAD